MKNESEVFSFLKSQIKELPIFKVINEDKSYIKNLAKQFEKFEDILVFGIGGSSLGGKCLVNFQSAYAGRKSKVKFVENADSRSFLNVVNGCDKNKTGIIVISKSGKTTETLMLFLTLCEIWKDFDYQNNAIAITELSEDNDLRLLAESKRMRVFEHDKNIGGRFSAFSIVGLLPALLEGFDIDSFILGAKSVISDIETSRNWNDCSLFRDVFSMYQVFESGKVREHVLFIYSDLLEDFGKWFAQLIAESLGKSESFSVTPIRALGTVDQHSLLQLFLGGPLDKLFTVVIQKNNCETEVVSCDINSSVIKQLKNHNINQLMIAHQKAVIECLKKKTFVRVLEFEEFNAKSLGFLMALSFVEVVCIANFAGVNPFDQPAVEEAKRLVMKYLKE